MVFMSFSKGSWLAGIIVLMGIMLLYPGPMVRTLVAIAIFMGVFGTGLLAVQLEQASSRLEDESGNERMTANAAMLNMLEASPLYGWGYGNLDNLISDYVVSVDGFYARQSASHNTSLALLAELGGLGFLLYYFPAFYWLKLTINAWPCMPRAGFASRVLVALLWLSILFHFVVGNFSDFRTGPSGVFSTTLWWLTLGLIAYLVYPSTQSELVPDTEKMGHDAGPKFSNRLI